LEVGPWFYRRQTPAGVEACFYSGPVIAKRLYFAFKPIWWLLHGWDQLLLPRWRERFGFGFDVLTSYPDRGRWLTTTDGVTLRSATGEETFSAIRSGAGTAAGTGAGADWNGWLYSNPSKSGTFSYLARWIATFDTSPMGSGAVISSAYLALHGYFKNNTLGTTDLHLTSAAPAAYNDLAASDYSSLGTTSAGSISYAAFTIGSYNPISLNAYGLGLINPNGITAIGARLGWDLTGTFGGTWAVGAEASYMSYSADVYTEGLAPKLVVVYTKTAMPKVIVVDS
jgi:hypothetical protein